MRWKLNTKIKDPSDGEHKARGKLNDLEKKENKRKVKRNEEKRIKQKAHLLLGQLISREEGGKVFDSIKKKTNNSKVETIDVEFSGKSVNRLQLFLCCGYWTRAFFIRA